MQPAYCGRGVHAHKKAVRAGHRAQQKSNIIAYQIRQSFRPGEITAEEANRIGYELASRFLKANTLLSLQRIPIGNTSTITLSITRPLWTAQENSGFFFSGLAVQRLSDLICLEHQLSVIEKEALPGTAKRILTRQGKQPRPAVQCNRRDFAAEAHRLRRFSARNWNSRAMKSNAANTLPLRCTAETLYPIQDSGCRVQRGRNQSGAGWQVEHHPRQKQPPKEQPFQLLVDTQAKLAEGKAAAMNVGRKA